MKNSKYFLVSAAVFIASFTAIAQGVDGLSKPATPVVELLTDISEKTSEQSTEIFEKIADQNSDVPESTDDQFYGADPDFILSLPENANKTLVSSVSELDSALKKAKPGDAIIVKSGTYNLSGTVSNTNSGTQAAPIYLVAESKEKVIFKGSRSWRFDGEYWAISGFIFDSFKERLVLNGNNIRFSGNRFRDAGAPLLVFTSNSEISHNIWTGTTSLSIITAQSGITCTNCKFPKGTHIHHNTITVSYTHLTLPTILLV